MNLYLRSYMKQKVKNKKQAEKFGGYEWSLTFDTETTPDMYQNLIFGYFEVRQYDELIEKGLFYTPNSPLNALKTLQAFSKDNQITLYSLNEFIGNIFYKVVHKLKGVCIGFNLPFDLSRIALRYGVGRKKNKDSFTFTLTDNPYFPNVRIKHRDNSCSFMGFTGSLSKKWFRGYFLDVRTLAIVLSSEKSLSLAKACEIFNNKGMKTTGEHGKITPNYIQYCINDVKITYELYANLMTEFNKYNLSIPPHKIYSSASLGKQLLKELNIKPFSEQNPDFPELVLGNLMSAYYGGRTNCKYRRVSKLVTTLDFLSMYPTTFTIMGLWDFLIAERIVYEDWTEQTKELLENITIEDLQKQETWKELTILCKIKPEKDILPIRSKYGKNAQSTTIGINELTSEAIYYTLPDIISSKLLTGKTPTIIKAIKFKPVGTQKYMRKKELLGIKLNPKENVIKELIEKRTEYKQKAKTNPFYNHKQKALKIFANSTSYGIFLETNNTGKTKDLCIYSNNTFNTTTKYEEAGVWFNPIIAVHQIAGSRLLLAMAESHLQTLGGDYIYMDTDSVYTNPKHAKALQELFQPLQPYTFDKPFLEIEKENKMFYGISSKRYCLYTEEKGKIIINDNEYKLHGLGHIKNPFGKNVKNWQKQIWKDILELEKGNKTNQDIQEKYNSFFALTQQTVTKPRILKKFKTLNKKTKDQNKHIKPFNFFLNGQVNITNKKPIKPITSFSDNPQSCVNEEFIDYESGRIMKGEEYWMSLDTTFFNYIEHPESKFSNGNEKGKLKRRKITNPRIKHIGKEVANIEEGLENAELSEQDPTIIVDLTLKERKEKKISRQKAYYWRKKSIN